jgi:hypothetical protein
MLLPCSILTKLMPARLSLHWSPNDVQRVFRVEGSGAEVLSGVKEIEVAAGTGPIVSF